MVSPKEYIFNVFKKLGKADAYTRELGVQIDNGVPEIRHPYKEKDRDGHEGQSFFHIKKSDRNNYFLNKFDLEVKREGQTKVVRETFYVNDEKRIANSEQIDKAKYFTNFTFKKAFNYLLGRPVRNEYFNSQGQKYKAWDLIDFKAPLGEGKYERRSFHDNYGFDLEKVMHNYMIKDLATPAFKESLIQSLERGNLQSTKFVGNDGKETELFVSPNIRLGSLNVFMHNKETNKKEIVQLDTLEKNGWITKEYAEVIRARIKDISQKNAQSNNQAQSKATVKEQQDKPAKEEKEGERVTRKRTVKEKPGKEKPDGVGRQRKNKNKVS